jgi:hypothetical protein
MESATTIVGGVGSFLAGNGLVLVFAGETDQTNQTNQTTVTSAAADD